MSFLHKLIPIRQETNTAIRRSWMLWKMGESEVATPCLQDIQKKRVWNFVCLRLESKSVGHMPPVHLPQVLRLWRRIKTALQCKPYPPTSSETNPWLPTALWMFSSKPILIGYFPFWKAVFWFKIHEFRRNHQRAGSRDLLLAASLNWNTRGLHVVVSTWQPVQTDLVVSISWIMHGIGASGCCFIII